MDENTIGDTTKELAHQYSFTNPDKHMNHGSKADTYKIIPNALVPIPLETQLACQGQKSVVFARPYGRSNNVSKMQLQDGFCAIRTNSEIVSLNESCTNPRAPHTSSPSFTSVTPVQPAKTSIQYRELETIFLQKQNDKLTKENISITMSVCDAQAGKDEYKLEVDDTLKNSKSNKHKFDKLMVELTMFKEKAREDAIQ